MSEEKKGEQTTGIETLAKQYVAWEPHEPFRKQVETALSAKDSALLVQMFGKRIAFGTAGLRAKMAGGYAYMNDLVIIQTSQGLCKYVDKHITNGKKKGVIIGYDGRHNSKRFAEIAATVFKDYGFHIYFFNRYAATPLVPVGILQLKCACGIVVTASHNPKDDNGFKVAKKQNKTNPKNCQSALRIHNITKVYWENGAQIIPPHDEGIAACIEENLKPWKHYEPFALDKDTDQKEIDITERVGDAYFSEIASRYCYHKDENKDTKLKVTYTAMHGVGTHWITKAYKAFDLPDFIPVKEQIDPDPDFSTVKFPNPEEGAGALSLAIKTADANDSPLIIGIFKKFFLYLLYAYIYLYNFFFVYYVNAGQKKIYKQTKKKKANDPDADRLAIAEKMKNKKEWKIFNGNEIAILLSDWAFVNYMKRHPKADVSKLVMIASTVSSKYLQSYATKNGFHFEDTLTGFKWMGNKAVDMIHDGYVFLFAFEVEIGFLIGDLSFDK
ncbi:hypothetical protein RFI_31884, partial [Reticulomyxa filosa]